MNMQTVEQFLSDHVNQMEGYVGLQLPFVGRCTRCDGTFIVHEKTCVTDKGGFVCDGCYVED